MSNRHEAMIPKRYLFEGKNGHCKEHSEGFGHIKNRIHFQKETFSINRHKNDITVYQPIKALGLFTAMEETLLVEEPTGEILTINTVRIDLPRVRPQQDLLPAVNESFTLLAKYIAYHQLDVDYIVGTTYEKLAKASQRWGFTIVEPLSKKTAQDVKTYYPDTPHGKEGKPMGEVLSCFQTKEEFLQRFLSPRP